jgi:acyl-CoA thioester hydrolase
LRPAVAINVVSSHAAQAGQLALLEKNMTKPMITREQFPYWHTIEVRWGDMDAMGHVNNAAYFTFCESARIALLRGLDIKGRAEGSQYGPTLVATSCEYKREVRYPATLDVGVRVTALSQRSFTMEYALFLQGTDDVAATARSVNAWVDFAARKAVALPEELRARLASYGSAA